MALVDIGAECSLVHGKPEQFPGHRAHVDGYGGQNIEVKVVSLTLEIGRLFVQVYTVYVSPVPELILETEVLQGLVLWTSVGEFCPQVHVVKAVMRGYAKHPPQVLPMPWRAVTMRQYCLLGGHKEIDATIATLTKVDTVCFTQSAFNSPVWPVWKPDGPWWMTVDYRN